ncbi:hypothetical protein NDU88_005080 [Pleurodeles waltl]|uniref:Uncharacterized protein n=1 Tax=Pleurodeles waltl TaxID=8319 RepID=A0AAV7VKG9_PLEWA|nr:hypothetical protein NDU88_005080 [Pleurodeles waltl]
MSFGSVAKQDGRRNTLLGSSSSPRPNPVEEEAGPSETAHCDCVGAHGQAGPAGFVVGLPLSAAHLCDTVGGATVVALFDRRDGVGCCPGTTEVTVHDTWATTVDDPMTVQAQRRRPVD